MEWQRINASLLDDRVMVSLPDRVWRLAIEIDLLVCRQGGPIEYNIPDIAWALRHEVAEVEGGLDALIESGLLVVKRAEGSNLLVWHDWEERNAPYMHKAMYNKQYYQKKRKGGNVTKDESDAEFDALPSASEELRKKRGGDSIDAIETLRQSAKAEWRVWANANKLIYNAPDYIQQASYLLLTLAGFEPIGKANSWVAQVSELVLTAGGDMDIVESAIKAGMAAKAKDHLTFRGPKSFCAWAKDLRATRLLSGNGKGKHEPTLIDLDANQDGSDITIEVD